MNRYLKLLLIAGAVVVISLILWQVAYKGGSYTGSH